MVWYGARLLSRNFLDLVTFYIQLITNILKQLFSVLSVFPHLLLNLSIILLGLNLLLDLSTVRTSSINIESSKWHPEGQY